MAALGPQLLALAGRLADGTLTWCVGPDTLRDFTVPTITAAAEDAGRPAPRIIAALPVAVTADPAAARERAAATFAIYGQLPSYRAMLDREGVAGPADLAILGSEQQVADGVAALADVGVTDFAAAEIGATADEREATRACSASSSEQRVFVAILRCASGWLLLASLGKASDAAAVRRASRTHRVRARAR